MAVQSLGAQLANAFNAFLGSRKNEALTPQTGAIIVHPTHGKPMEITRSTDAYTRAGGREPGYTLPREDETVQVLAEQVFRF